MMIAGRLTNISSCASLCNKQNLFGSFTRAFCAEPRYKRPHWRKPIAPPVILRPSHEDPKGLKGAGALYKEPKAPLFFSHPNPTAPVVKLPEELTTGPNAVNPESFDKFAVVAINKKQHKVTVGDRVMTDLMASHSVGDVLTFNEVLLVGTTKETAVGRPLLSDAVVTAEVQEHPWLKDLYVFKRRRRKGYKRTWKVRTQVSILQILDIQYDKDNI